MSERTIGTGERRRESRFRVNIPAKIRGLEPAAFIGPLGPATVVNLSLTGLRLLVDREFPPRTCVQVFAFHEVLLGHVKHCSRDGAQFEVAVKLRETADAPTPKRLGS